MASKHKRAAVAAGRWYRKGVREGGTRMRYIKKGTVLVDLRGASSSSGPVSMPLKGSLSSSSSSPGSLIGTRSEPLGGSLGIRLFLQIQEQGRVVWKKEGIQTQFNISFFIITFLFGNFHPYHNKLKKQKQANRKQNIQS